MKQKIAVIGAGVIGLTTALKIQKEFGENIDVTIYTADKSPNTTGDVSAGLWTPYLLQDTPEDKIIKWAKETQDLFWLLWKNGYASDAGISLQPMIYLWCDTTSLPKWSKIAIGCNEIKGKELERFQNDQKIPYTGGFTFNSFICEPKKFLPFLENIFINNGGEIKINKIEKFSQLKNYDVIVNCTGIYSKILMRDERVKAIRGQILRVEASWQFHTIMDNSDDGCYIIPNENCVILGGTHQLDDEDTKPRIDDASRILKGCKQMVPSLHEAKILRHQVGLRPGRDQIRLELSSTNIGNKSVPLIHNYGHGGSGITLCYGCASEAVDLVKIALIKSKL
nr:D-aspartate oxidase-like [Onthophagus taurus]